MICVLCLSSTTVVADEIVRIDEAFEMTLLITELGIVCGTGVVFAVGNLTYAACPECSSPQSWRAGGYISGVTNLVAGAIWLVAALEGDNLTFNGDNLNLFWIAIPHFVTGAMGIGFTLWGSRELELEGQKLSVSPVIMHDVEGKTTFGVGLRLVNW
jgi:hypothetical protein